MSELWKTARNRKQRKGMDYDVSPTISTEFLNEEEEEEGQEDQSASVRAVAEIEVHRETASEPAPCSSTSATANIHGSIESLASTADVGCSRLLGGIQAGLQADISAAKALIGRGEENLQVIFNNVKERVHVKEAAEQAERLARQVIEVGKRGWRVVAHWELPEWLRDNDFIDHGHRPPLDSFRLCFKSIFRIHTETGNIWTHLLGFIAFVCVTLYFFLKPVTLSSPFPKDMNEKIVFGSFFGGALFCLAFSTLYHTMDCHSDRISNLFSRLDYTGIALLIIGSFIPCLYYGFYCYRKTKIIYICLVCFLGLCCIFISLWEKFNTPKYRVLRAVVFISLGCSGIIPFMHILIAHGITFALRMASLGWMILMGSLYITGAMLYATRIPERFFPGKCNIVFQSHQIFHVLVVAGAFVHLHGVCQMAYYRFTVGSCPD